MKLFGEEVAVRAKVVNFQGLSSHADHDHLVNWISQFKGPSPSTFSWSTATGRWRRCLLRR